MVYYHINSNVQHPKITRTFCRTTTNDYTILNSVQDKETRTHQERRCPPDDVSYLSTYRSVILEWQTLDVYSMSPPTSVSIDDFFALASVVGDQIDHERIWVDEWVEGTMMNLWFDSNADRWEISTKNSVGGRYTYRRNHRFEEVDFPTFPTTPSIHSEHVGCKSYRDMFIEAITGHVFLHEEECEHSLYDAVNTLNLCKHYSYSFVLQHPENSLVLNSDVPCLYLVAVYYVPYEYQNMTTIQRIDPEIYQNWPCLTSVPHIKFPRKIPSATYSSLFHTYHSIHADVGEVGMGVCLTDRTTGIRTKMTSTAYLEWKDYRGIQPNLLFQYLCLKYANNLDDFLVHFPGYALYFDDFQRQYSTFLVNIHASYVSYYIRHSRERISPRFMPYIYRLHHDIFLPSKATSTRRNITLDVVREYMDQFSPEDMFWILVLR